MEVEAGDDRMSEEAGDEVEGEGEVASPDSRVRAGPRNRPTQNRRERARSNTRAVQRVVYNIV